jgi:hypothetical protein
MGSGQSRPEPSLVTLCAAAVALALTSLTVALCSTAVLSVAPLLSVTLGGVIAVGAACAFAASRAGHSVGDVVLASTWAAATNVLLIVATGVTYAVFFWEP